MAFYKADYKEVPNYSYCIKSGFFILGYVIHSNSSLKWN